MIRASSMFVFICYLLVLLVGFCGPLKSEGKDKKDKRAEQGEEGDTSENFGKVRAFHAWPSAFEIAALAKLCAAISFESSVCSQ